jgi:hypothetical protein
MLGLSTGELVIVAAIIVGIVYMWMGGSKKPDAAKPAVSKKAKAKSWRSALNHIEDIVDSEEANTAEITKLMNDLRQQLTAKLGS